MTTSEIIRAVLIVILAVILVVRMRKPSGRRLAQQKKKQQEDVRQRRAELRSQAIQQRQVELEKKERQTAQVLRSALGADLVQKVATVAGQQIHYLDGGAGACVLLLHGFASTKEDWSDFAQHLIAAGYRVVAPDLPGFGQNPVVEQPHDVTSQTKRIRAFGRDLGLEPVHLVGSSVGGMIAAAYAYSARDSVPSLTLIEPLGVKVPYESELDKLLAMDRNPFAIATAAAYDNLLGFLYVRPPEMPESLRNLRAEDAAKRRSFLLQTWLECRGGDKANLLDLLLPEIQQRTLVIQGEKSNVVHLATAEMLRRIMKDAHDVVIADCGHFPMVERAEETARHVVEFLAAASPAS